MCMQASGLIHFVNMIHIFREDEGAPTYINISWTFHTEFLLSQNSALFPSGLPVPLLNISIVRKPWDIVYCQSLPTLMPFQNGREISILPNLVSVALCSYFVVLHFSLYTYVSCYLYWSKI